MKRLYIITLSVFLALVFLGCEGRVNEADASWDIYPLAAGDEVEVLSGDKLINPSVDLEIEVVHTLDINTKSVKVLQGRADLLRGNYEIQ